MELGYETLWKACTAILLSFLVSWIVSLIIYSATPSCEVREKGFKLASTVDHDQDDDGKHKKLLKSAFHGGDRLNKVRSSVSKKKKRVKFVDPVAKFAEFQSLDDVSVKGIEFNAVECGEFGASGFVGNRESEGKEGIKSRESEEVGKDLVDLKEKGQKLVGFEGNEEREHGEVGGELGSDKIVGCDGFNGGERIVDQKDGKGHEIGVVLGIDEVVDDQRIEEAKIRSNVYEEERRVEEFASGENDVDGIDKIVECQRFDGGERITSQRREEAEISSNVYEEERRVEELASCENDVDGIDKIVECQGFDEGERIINQRKEEAKIPSNVYEEERRIQEFASGENDVDGVDKIVECQGFEGGERITNQRKEEAKIPSNVYEEERRTEEFASGENNVDGIDKIVECQGFEGGERITNQREEEAINWSNVCKRERIGGDFDGEGMLSDEEEWEGIERSELEKEFAQAKDFVKLGGNEGRLAMAGNDVTMQLYGLQKVAMEGPCHELQPMALKLSARAKWNAWQRLGNMSPEEAMEQYVDVLSKNVPEWTEHHSSVERKSKSSEEVHSSPDAHMSTSSDHESGCANERTKND